jgi:hypothetical protein
VQANQNGPAKVELKLDGTTVARSASSAADEKTDVGLPQLDRDRTHEIVCDSIRLELQASLP